jgi:hypothetical protein
MVPASGLAELPVAAFLPGLVIGSAFFLSWHFAIGYIGGIVLGLLNLLSAPVIVGLVVVVLALGIGGWLAVRRFSKRHAAASEQANLSERYAAWADASCPACIAITLIRERSGAEV